MAIHPGLNKLDLTENCTQKIDLIDLEKLTLVTFDNSSDTENCIWKNFSFCDFHWIEHEFASQPDFSI